MTATVLTVAEVADLFRCSTNTIRRAIQAGELDHVRVLGVVRVPASALPAALTLTHDSAAAVAADPAPGPAAVAAESAASGVAGSNGEQATATPPFDHPGGSN